MLTWLDHTCRQVVSAVPARWHNGDPRKALGAYLWRRLYQAKEQIAPFENILEEVFHVMLVPFVQEFFPAAATWERADGKEPHPLGLVLTRGTANLLSAADWSNIPDEAWHSALDPLHVYVDVPHGAVLLNVSLETGDVLQLRALFAAPLPRPDSPGHTLFIAQMTDQGSERGRGRTAGVLRPDGSVIAFGSNNTGKTATDRILRPPFVHPLAEKAVLARAGTFLRLVLAYHFFGPQDVREPIAPTPTERLRNGKPRKDESLFALTRLRESSAVGRPKSTIPASWSLTSRQEVAGHFKLQPYGPQQSQRRLIWVDAYERGPEDAPAKPRAYIV